MSKTFAIIFGIVFVIIGLLGFISNPIVGAEGFFHTDTLHNIVHLVVGVILLIVATNGEAASRSGLRVFAVIYLLLAIIGFVQLGGEETGEVLGLVSSNAADNWLHLVLAIVLYVVTLKKPASAAVGPTM